MTASSSPIRLTVASSNPGKLREFRVLAESAGASIELSLLPNFSALPEFEEAAPTFAENAVGKALHYSRFTGELLLADDSGLVVPELGGAPGVYSARYAGPGATDADRVQKLLREMRGKTGDDRRARFVSVISIARRGECRGIFSGLVEGVLLEAPRGEGGFGYDPIFLIPSLGKTFSEISPEEKNRYSHRGMAFRKAISCVEVFGGN